MWPLTNEIPKGLLPLAGVPFIEYQLRQLRGVGVDRVVLAVGTDHLPAWERYVDHGFDGLALTLAVEETPLDTAGPIRAVLDRLDDRFFVLNGDVVVEADLARVATVGGPAAIGLVEVEDTSAYGVVVTDEAGVVEQFVEKPPIAEAPARTVSAGMYVLTRDVFASYDAGPLSFERVVFPSLVEAGDLRAVTLQGHWIDIGTPELYLAAHDAVYAGATGLHRPAKGHESHAERFDGDTAGRWSWVGLGAVVEAGATIEESVIMDGAVIGEGAVIRRAVVGSSAGIGRGVTVTGASLVGPGAIVGDGCEIDAGMRVAPGTRLDERAITFRPPR